MLINLLTSLIILTCIKETISGDSFILTNLERLKLSGIQAPKPYEPYFIESRNFLNSKIYNKLMKLDKTSGVLWVNKVNINELIIREGWARALNPKMKELERIARLNHKGIWK